MAKKADLNTKAGKLWLEIQKGKPKKVAAEIAGVNPKNVSHVMSTDNYQALEASSLKEEIQKHILSSEIAREHVELIKQNEELSVKLNAIKLAYEKIEPEGAMPDKPEKILVILKK